MSDRHKYAFNGVCFFENARELMEENEFVDGIPIGRIGGIDGWYLRLRSETDYDSTYYEPFIFTNENRLTVKCRYYFGILKNDGSSSCSKKRSLNLEPLYGLTGKGISVDEWLDEKNGYLTDGGITIEYSFQIEGFLSRNDNWTFNFYDPLFDCQKKMITFSFYTDSEEDEIKFLYCHKQLLVHHSTYFNSDSTEIELIDENLTHFNNFLQFSHGVRDRETYSSFYDALMYAQKYKLFNVIQLVDQLMVFDPCQFEGYFHYAVLLKRYLVRFLKKQKTLEELALSLKIMRIESLSGEAMKQCVKRFLEF